MDKLKFLKSNKHIFRDTCRISNSYRQANYVDYFLREGEKAPFRHDWKILAHMHDLRLWTIAYAPQRLNNVQRLQELHLLNNEMWYMVSQALWRRVFFMIVGWFLVTKFFKKKFMNQGNFDS